MSIEGPESISNVISFGRHKARPRACVIESKPHTRAFLQKALGDAGFVACACASLGDLAAEVERQPPRLVVHCVSPDGIESAHVLRALAAARFQGAILLLAPRGLPALAAVRQAAEELGLQVLPPLFTPFSDESLRVSVATLLPRRGAADAPGRCRRGGDGGLARAVVPAEDQCPVAVLRQRGGACAHASSALGDRAAGVFHSRRQRSALAGIVRVRHWPGDRRLAALRRRSWSCRDCDQSSHRFPSRSGIGRQPVQADARPPGLRAG